MDGERRFTVVGQTGRVFSSLDDSVFRGPADLLLRAAVSLPGSATPGPGGGLTMQFPTGDDADFQGDLEASSSSCHPWWARGSPGNASRGARQRVGVEIGASNLSRSSALHGVARVVQALPEARLTVLADARPDERLLTTEDVTSLSHLIRGSSPSAASSTRPWRHRAVAGGTPALFSSAPPRTAWLDLAVGVKAVIVPDLICLMGVIVPSTGPDGARAPVIPEPAGSSTTIVRRAVSDPTTRLPSPAAPRRSSTRSGALPGEVLPVRHAAEVAVRRRAPVDRLLQLERLDDADAGVEVERARAPSLRDLLVRHVAGAERVDQHRDRVGDADGVRDLHLAACARQLGGDDVLRDVAREVGGAAVDLARILAAEGAAAVPADSRRRCRR